MADYDYLPVSSGGGDAILMHITADRAVGATTIAVDSVVNVPAKFIGTSGTLLASGFIDPTTKKDFKGHVDTGSLIIDAFEPGSTDIGNTEGQVVIIKPNTGWANRVAAFIKNATGFGTPENIYVNQLLTTTPSIKDANGNVIFATDRWTSAAETWAYASATTLTVPTDATLKYALGDVIKFTQSSTVKRGVITGVTATVLTVSMLAGDTIANVAITANYYSKTTPGTTLAGAAPFTPYAFSVYRNAALTSASSWTKVAFDAKTFDTGTNVDVVTNKGRFTAPVAGLYRFSAAVGQTTGGLNVQNAIALHKNGTRIKIGTSTDPTQNAGGNFQTVSGLVQLAASDYVEVYFIAGSGSSISVGADLCFFDGQLVSLA